MPKTDPAGLDLEHLAAEVGPSSLAYDSEDGRFLGARINRGRRETKDAGASEPQGAE